MSSESNDQYRRRSLAAHHSNSQLPATDVETEDEREIARARKRQRLQSRKSQVYTDTSTASPSTGKSGQSSAISTRSVPLTKEQLVANYKVCINLSSANKIAPTNAFSLHLIDYMGHLIKQENVNFTMATTALDVGTKIYVNRVDCVHTDAQKCANSIIQALDTKGKIREEEDQEETQEENPDASLDQEKDKKKTVRKTKKKGNTLAASEDTLNLTKLETNIDIDPIFHKLTAGHDMGNVNALFLTNLSVAANSSLILDSNAVNEVSAAGIKLVEQTNSNHRNQVSLDKPFVELLKDVCSKTGVRASKSSAKGNYRILADKYLNEFLFAAREANIDVEYHRDASMMDHDMTRKSEFTFDLNAEVFENEDDGGEAHEGLGLSFEDEDDLLMDVDDDGVPINRANKSTIALHQSILQAVNLESLPDLKMLLSSEGGEYSYFKNLGVTGSWAGPKFWKKNLWLKMKQIREARQAAIQTQQEFDENGDPIPSTSMPPPPPTTRKTRGREEIPFLDFSSMFTSSCTPEKLHFPSNQQQKLKVATLQKWSANAGLLTLPPHQHLDPASFLRPFNKDACFFSLVEQMEKAATRSRSGSKEENQMEYSLPNSPQSVIDGGDMIDDVLPQPIDFDPLSQQSTNINPFGLTATATQATTTGGFDLVDEPDAIKHVVIPFAKYAKRMDVKKLKRAILNRITAGEEDPEQSFTGIANGSKEPTVDQPGVKLSQVYSELPREIPPQMTKDMSPGIAFVTLLHLANEHNLVLENEIKQSRDPAQLLATYTSLDGLKDIVIRRERPKSAQK